LKHKHPTANIGKLGESANFKVNTQNEHIDGLIGEWLEKPSLPIFANRRQHKKHYYEKNDFPSSNSINNLL